MSNQRAGKKLRPMGDTGSLMREMLFFKSCKEVLQEYGHEDAAFYFGQVEDHMRNGGTLDAGKVGNILGV